MSACKRCLLLVAFVLLCFTSITVRARSLQAATNEAPKVHVDLSTPKQDGVGDSDDNILAMDYTPTKKKPPIHN
ncbi:hypothetical protein I3760_03G125500 [Carya illinoinensis]|uniref:Root meristem growth factor 9 n=1 Tax=Carya illinoinensis TaxID=32201 RepID=A0A8T1R1S3_CARIL|nr:hypothetical protein I3760_03G125500 [Carya illinoinensis]KAG6660826.1 hypothetical protein CIPAW_03G131600 [Carya illinoinensis]KAG6721763.1 hypothetical protein I3842_03G127800 [Carya illinoinensis]